SSGGGELDFALCNGQAQPMEPAHSGMWYRPDMAGEGYSLMQLESGDWILYAFEPGSQAGGQVWTLEQTAHSEVPVEFRG
ncbi:hypothetical protein SB717_39055, partial [Priestia sp. SIMBA_032]|uniref:hypothetical protein n=1 Tax=Priestia sp. SIMBA_032 TaxID=3085775 RepID=UPI0039792C5C